MSTDQFSSTLDKPICDYVRGLSDERLKFLISTPPLGLDLLEHAAFCNECGKRIEELGNQVFANFPAEEQKELKDWAAAFVARNFPARSHIFKPDSTTESTDSARTSSFIDVEKTGGPHREFRLAASESKDTLEPAGPSFFGEFAVGSETFKIFELAEGERTHILLKGPVPTGATRVVFGGDFGHLAEAGQGYWEITEIASTDISDFLRNQLADPQQFPPVSFN